MSDFVPGYELSNWVRARHAESHTPAEIVDTLDDAVNEGLTIRVEGAICRPEERMPAPLPISAGSSPTKR